MVLVNARSIRPKPPNYNFDELASNVSFMREYRDACVMCISETWFDDRISDGSVFTSMGLVCRTAVIAIQLPVANIVCLCVNEQYCNRGNVTVRQRLCTPDLELICVTAA